MTKEHFVFVLFMLVSLTLPCTAFSASVNFSGENPSYTNARYGFSVSLPAGNYKAEENDDGEGIAIKDGKGFTLLAYGTNSFIIFERSFTDAVLEIRKEFDSVVETITKPEENIFIVTGLKGGNLIHIKCILGPKHANVLRITHGKSAHETYKKLCTTALDTFK